MAVLLGLGLSAWPVGRSGSAPFRGLQVSFVQPDGARLDIVGWGDEFDAVFETLDGYTVVFDPDLRAYCFAQKTPDGRLVSTGTPAHRADGAALGLARHERLDPRLRRDQARARHDRWEQGTELARRWQQRKADPRAAAEWAASGNADHGGLTPQHPPSSTTTGTRLGLCLLIDFDDDPATVPQAEIIDFCNGDNYTGYGNCGSVKQYFADVSNGLLIYSNVVTVYVRIPNTLHPKSYYNNPAKDCGSQANLLIRDALAILKALPNYTSTILPTFSQLTVDANNRILACNVFYAGANSGVWNYGLWPHSWALYNVGAQELSPGGKKVYSYQITDIGARLTIGTFCHENGHMLCGYPDVYDYNYDSTGGAGMFCLMGDGNYGNGGLCPAQICAYLNRADLRRAKPTGSFAIRSPASRPSIFWSRGATAPTTTLICPRTGSRSGTWMNWAIRTTRAWRPTPTTPTTK